MSLIFEWDQNKAVSNLSKHNVSFEEASTIFGDDNALTIADPAHSIIEERKIIMGWSINERILVAVFTERGNSIRIISARSASRKERKQYEGK